MNELYIKPPKISLKAARVNAGLPQNVAAQRLGICAATLQKYESGATVPNWEIVKKIEETYHYPVDFIFFGSKTRF